MYKERLEKYKSWANEAIPPELTKLSAQYQDKLVTLLRLTWEAEDPLRSFSPLAKGFLKPKQLIYANQQFLPQEKAYLTQFAKILFETYGDPIFKYTGFDENVPAVRQFQALQRFSPKVTPGANKRRFDAMQKYFTSKTFNPDKRIYAQALKFARIILNLPKVDVNFEPQYVRGLFSGHASNVGFPFYSNELSKKDDKTYRDHTVDLTKKLIDKYKSCKWITTIPAIIIGRDQPGGNTLDLTKTYTKSSLLKALKNIEYLPSKARPVWAVARIVNNVIIPVLKAIITHDQFLKNPLYCGFLSREQRFVALRNYDRFAKAVNKIPANVDIKSLDTSISAPLLLDALDLCFETVNLTNAPEDTIESIKASAIFTHAIAIDPNTKKIFKATKSNCIASGHGTTGYSGLVVTLIAMLYGYISVYGTKWVEDLIYKAKQHNTSFSFGLGDDFLGLIDDISDLPKIAAAIEEAFGMVISVESTKTAIGVDFLQELYWNDNIEYPIARLAPSALYTERASHKGFAMWDMSYASMLYNIRTNPERTLEFVTSIFQALDSTDLGLKNIDGQELSPAQFVKYLTNEVQARGSTVKQLLWDGDPSKESKFLEDGGLKSDYLEWYFSLIKKTRDATGPFSTAALRAFWREFN